MGITRVDNEGRTTYYHNPTMRVVDVENAPENASWEWLRAQRRVNIPEAGMHLFIDTFGDAGWVISTKIVTVEESV